MRIEDFVDCLLSFDCIQTFEDIADRCNEELTTLSFDLNSTFRILGEKDLLNLF